jgi:hypothetical protein
MTIDDYEIIKPISRGAFGRVYLAKKKATGDLFAIKVMRKADLIRKNMVQSVKNERNILAMANNPFVVRPRAALVPYTCVRVGARGLPSQAARGGRLSQKRQASISLWDSSASYAETTRNFQLLSTGPRLN